MLLIRRNAGESVRIGDALVTVLTVAGGRVTIGIEAPRAVPIERLDRKPTPKPEPERVDD